MRIISKLLILLSLVLLTTGMKAEAGYAPNVTEKDYVAYLFTYFHGNSVE